MTGHQPGLGDKRTGIGELLVERGDITPEQLEEALQRHREGLLKGQRGLLGQILVDLGFTTEEAVNRAVANQTRVEYVSLADYPVDPRAPALIDPDLARRFQALPIGFEEGRLVVAMMHPNDLVAIDDLRLVTGQEIKPVSVSDSELRAAIEKHDRRSSTENVALVEEEGFSREEARQDLRSDVTDNPAVQLTKQIFTQAIRSGASDVHIEPGEKSMRIRLRLDGVLQEVMRPPLSLHPSLVSRIKVMAGMDIANRRIPQDGRTTVRLEERVIDLRVATLPSVYGEKLTLRLLDRGSRMFSLSELGFPRGQLKRFNEAIKVPHGCILVTGPTGSGKTTTLYAVLMELNKVEKHIITVEDPIEYRLAGINQVQVNPQAGLTFATGLRSILRNDPDIIMVGEIRDRETARIAVESALTGHLVLSTLHTNDAAGAVTRLGDMEIEPYLTASSLVAVLAQRLVRLLCRQCRQDRPYERQDLLTALPDFPLRPEEESFTIYEAVGCPRCSNTGYRGRIGVFELLTLSDTLRSMSLQRRSSGEIAAQAAREGMVTLRRDALLKVREGLTSVEEALRVV